MRHGTEKHSDKKSIFRSLFIPLFLIMILQASIFYFAAVYGGLQESLSQNAADILSERLINRKNEIETRFNNKWASLDDCAAGLEELYESYEDEYGGRPLALSDQRQIEFLSDSSRLMVDTLRRNQVNGVFLILNDQIVKCDFARSGEEQKYGLCIRDMDQDSNYSGREDLLLERAPSSIVDSLGCQLDSGWEARYSFASKEDGEYYYYPLDAAWDRPGAAGGDLAYFSGPHKISGSGAAMVVYSIPLTDSQGYPYGVLGVEVSVKYLAQLLPARELNDPDKSCYVLAVQNEGEMEAEPIFGTGALYSRCFGGGEAISCANETKTGGFAVTGRGGVALYGDSAELGIYTNNNPFEQKKLVLLALVESDTLFAYIDRVKLTLLLVSIISLALGIAGIVLVSRRFAAPITALARRVRGMKDQSGFQLERLGISEIDQLVDSIEELNRNVSKNSARTEFFSRMSHDMRTPMNAIISFSSPEMLEGADEVAKDEYLDKIHASGQYLLGLINEVLDMTKIESSKTELRLEALEAARIFDAAVPVIEKLAAEKGVEFSRDIYAPAGLWVMADRQHLGQIFMNLLSNAVKFTPAGGRVALEAAFSDGPEPETALCRVRVADTGIGMSREFMEKLYTPFEQENARGEGTGLGLSIARKLVELMGGAIECVSRQNEGTEFTVSVPLARCPAAELHERLPEPEENGDREVLRGKRLLICEDNSINTQIICHLLEREGITTETAADGAEGVAAFAQSEQGHFDGVLMDIRMPKMDGLAATRAIRALPRPDAASIPIIAMTANAFEEDVRASEAAGMNAHLAKPVEPKKLYAALVHFLSINSPLE